MCTGVSFAAVTRFVQRAMLWRGGVQFTLGAQAGCRYSKIWGCEYFS